MKNPKLKFRYINGFGDFVAWFLHSLLIGWLTKLITGKKEPCQVCSQRAHALNFLIPFPIWKLFFKNKENFISSLEKELKDYGYSLSKPPVVPVRDKTIPPPIPKIEDDVDGYLMISSSDNQLGEYLVRVQTFKRK